MRAANSSFWQHRQHACYFDINESAIAVSASGATGRIADSAYVLAPTRSDSWVRAGTAAAGIEITVVW